MPHMMTVGDVARSLDVPRARVDYALEKGGIRERSRAGILRLFAVDQLPAIRATLQTIKVREARRPQGPDRA